MTGRRGRPSGSKTIHKGTSKEVAKCAICSFKKRCDKVKEHQIQLVLFDKDGNPSDSSHPNYHSLSDNEKLHTDYFRKHGYHRLNLPRNKVVRPSTPGDIDRFFNKKPRTDQTSNVGELPREEESDNEEEAEGDIGDGDAEGDIGDGRTTVTVSSDPINNNRQSNDDGDLTDCKNDGDGESKN